MTDNIHDKLITNAFEINKHVRDNKLDRNKQTEEFGHVVARIPYTVTYVTNPDGTKTVTGMDMTGWNALTTLHPELNSQDPEICKKAWTKFLKSQESMPYKVDGSIGNKRRDSHNIIIK
jgi:hypothetical protein